jgi:2,4-dienoyl-CoA reductase-like NADH-dependent reductase (Old Yellow Enzyme family)
MLQFFSASTGVVNSKRAITECIENALEGQQDLDCDLIIIYTAIGHNFKEILHEAKILVPNAIVTGCTCAGVIGREGPNESLRALAIMAVKGPKNEFAVAGIPHADYSNPYDTGRKLAGELRNKAEGINMILFHPSVGNMMPFSECCRGIESVFGPDVPLIGGVSIDNMKFVSNYQFISDQIFERGAIMIGFADPTLEVITAANHGFEIIGKPFEATRHEGNHIFEFDGKPAWKSWTERLGMHVTTSAMDVLSFAPLAVELPIENQDEYGSKYLVYGALPDKDGSIYGTMLFAEGTKFWITRRNEKGIHEGVERMMVQLLEKCRGRIPVAVFHADCAARGRLLLNRIVKEEIIGQMQYPLCRDKKVPWLGMYGAGEFAPLGGRNEVHQYTTSLFLIVKKETGVKEEKINLRKEVVKASRLFEPTTIKNLKLKNRFVCSATWSGKSRFNGGCSPILINSLLDIAKDGPGLIISEMAYILQNGQCTPFQMGVHDDSLIPGLNLLTENIHRKGIPIIMQLVHGGLFTVPMLANAEPFGPSVMDTQNGQLGREMTQEEIKEIVSAFGEAALRAQKAGFDGVQIHAAHGWLLSQFLSPYFNRRKDEYGGSIENRARIVLEVIRSIKESVREDFAVTIKINSDDFIPGGFGIEEMLKVSYMLEKEGIDAIEISGGTISALITGNVDCSFSPATKKGIYYLEAAQRFKEIIKVQLMLVGGVRTFESADEMIKTGVADYVSLCRPLIREPDLIKKWASGNLKRSDCISDSACFQPGAEGKGVHCVHVKQ